MFWKVFVSAVLVGFHLFTGIFVGLLVYSLYFILAMRECGVEPSGEERVHLTEDAARLIAAAMNKKLRWYHNFWLMMIFWPLYLPLIIFLMRKIH